MNPIHLPWRASARVIDFGIAKATEGRLTDATVYTQLHQFIGTPAYMSPEQAEMSGPDMDTRSGIYSLGALLYELLTGSTPFDVKGLMASGIAGMRKTIREKEPPRPGTKLTQALVAAAVRWRTPGEGEPSADSRRRLRLKETIHQLRGDLDWIVNEVLGEGPRLPVRDGQWAGSRPQAELEPRAGGRPAALERIPFPEGLSPQQAGVCRRGRGGSSLGDRGDGRLLAGRGRHTGAQRGLNGAGVGGNSAPGAEAAERQAEASARQAATPGAARPE
jgi:serine/threonine protein kinase